MDDREILRRNLKKKITTTMIGDLASFEETFGRLWGHHKDPNEPLTEQEQRFFDLWSRVREEILDRGNAQIGGMNKELDSYNIERYRYHVKFVNRRNNGRD